MTYVVKLCLCLVLWSSSFLLKAQESGAGRVERVGGMYKLVKILKRNDESFSVSFESQVKSGKFDRLILYSDHVHVGLNEGQTLRISAEVVDSQGPELEITQVLLFLKGNEGTLPVWQLSRNFRGQDFHRGAKWLDMHAPQADFSIL